MTYEEIFAELNITSPDELEALLDDIESEHDEEYGTPTHPVFAGKRWPYIFSVKLAADEEAEADAESNDDEADAELDDDE